MNTDSQQNYNSLQNTILAPVGREKPQQMNSLPW